MMRRTLSLLALLPLAAVTVPAQESASGPPKVLALTREDIKPGRMGPHEKVAAGFVAAISKTPSASYRIGLVPMSGDENVVLYVEGFDSFADLEARHNQIDQMTASNAAFKTEMDQLDKQGADMHASQRTALYMLRPDLSFRPRALKDVPHPRYVSISTTRLKPGRGPDYVDYIKGLNTAREKANSEAHTAVYQVVTGAPTGTFITMTAISSLKQWDDDFAKMDANQRAINAALGGNDVVKQRRMLISEIVADGVSTLYAINPTISRPTQDVVAADPGFWKTRAQVAAAQAASTKATTAKKETPKQ
ncbi:MAG TPA: hypothetical protein VGL15_05725 [Vicinamibacteria bacterium]|jgi:hypothetical protein